MAATDLVIWRLSDGKRGHDSQSEGLVAALARLCSLTSHTIPVSTRHLTPLLECALARFADGRSLPTPDLIVGAGRATHWPLLAARRARGGRTICLNSDVLMAWAICSMLRPVPSASIRGPEPMARRHPAVIGTPRAFIPGRHSSLTNL